MLRYFTNALLYRRLGRAIPNPILRTVAIAGVGYAARRLTSRRAAGPTSRSPAGRPAASPARGFFGRMLGAR